MAAFFTEKVVMEGLGVVKVATLTLGLYMAAGRIQAGLENIGQGTERGLKGLMSDKGSGADRFESGFSRIADAIKFIAHKGLDNR